MTKQEALKILDDAIARRDALKVSLLNAETDIRDARAKFVEVAAQEELK